MKLYGAYGSNLNLKQMQRRCPNSYPLCSIYLENFILAFKGVADIEKQKGSICFMAVYEITNSCEKALDMYEEYPDVYEKNYIKKKIEGQYRDIMFYTMKKKYQYAVPSIKYFSVIKEGFINWNSSFKLLLDASLHSIKYDTDKGYKSENWHNKNYINKKFLKKLF